jgi:hypothetical protein
MSLVRGGHSHQQCTEKNNEAATAKRSIPAATKGVVALSSSSSNEVSCILDPRCPPAAILHPDSSIQGRINRGGVSSSNCSVRGHTWGHCTQEPVLTSTEASVQQSNTNLDVVTPMTHLNGSGVITDRRTIHHRYEDSLQAHHGKKGLQSQYVKKNLCPSTHLIHVFLWGGGSKVEGDFSTTYTFIGKIAISSELIS